MQYQPTLHVKYKYNIHERVKELREQGLNHEQKIKNSAYLVAYSMVMLDKERSLVDLEHVTTTDTDEVNSPLRKKSKNEKKKATPYDYDLMRELAGNYLEVEGEESCEDDNMDDEELKLARRRTRKKHMQYLSNKGLNDPNCIVILVPGTDACNDFLSSWNNGIGKSTKTPRVRLFQVANQPLAWVMDGLFKSVTALPKTPLPTMRRKAGFSAGINHMTLSAT
jgi:hypothetical protein